ncbi:MAG: hypothetical protein JXA54_07905 [Candidatus Heimdallarchaeota archaeon]|nr:hypothetical protein [Candidatus Heimdallarchaeota archaeon]
MGLLKKNKKEDTKKKTIPKKDILKAIKDVEYLDLGEPFGENARRYLAFQLSKMIDNEEIIGTVITPEGVYISLTSKEVKDVIRLINAKGICDLTILAQENKWNVIVVKLIAKNRISLIDRKDGKVITRNAASDAVYQLVNRNIEIDLTEVADELQLKKSITRELLDSLIADKKIDGYFIKSTNKFLPIDLLEESIKEKIEDYEKQRVVEVPFSEIADEYSISEEQVYNILLKLFNAGDIDVQLVLAKRLCLIKGNIKEEKWEEKIPEEQRKLEIEDLTKKN